MNFLNLGLPEVIFIIILALIIFGPNNMVKSAKEAGAFLRKVTKSPYWQEVWATKRELDELPKMLAKEANLNETIRDLDNSVKNASGSTKTLVSEFLKEVNQPAENNSEENAKSNTILPQAQELKGTDKKE
jgi:Sec-independent protein translocase protein TatA